MMRVPFWSGLKKAKERKILVSIYEQYHAAMERTAMRILNTNADAEDAVPRRVRYLRLYSHGIPTGKSRGDAVGSGEGRT